MNDFFTDETEEVSGAETQEVRDKIQAEVFEGTPAKFEEPDVVEVDSPTDSDSLPEPADSTESPDPVLAPPTLSPEMQAIVDSVNKLTGSLTGMEDRIKQTERRVGGITNEFHAAKEAAASQAKAPTPEEMAQAAKTEEAWTDLKNDFPSWAVAIEGKMLAQASQYVSVDDFEALRQSVKQTPSVDPNQLETRLVGLIHPDHKTIVADPNYATWLNSQPDDVQRKAYKGTTAEEAIDVFNKFKGSKGAPVAPVAPASNAVSEVEKIKAQNAARLAASTTTNTNHKSIKQKTEGDMTEAELRAHIAGKVFP